MYIWKPSINTVNGFCIFGMLFEFANYNESWKIKNTFLIADFINFLTKVF